MQLWREFILSMTETRLCLHCALFPTQLDLLVASRSSASKGGLVKGESIMTDPRTRGIFHTLSHQEHDFPCIHDRRPANAPSAEGDNDRVGQACRGQGEGGHAGPETYLQR